MSCIRDLHSIIMDGGLNKCQYGVLGAMPMISHPPCEWGAGCLSPLGSLPRAYSSIV